MSKIRLVSWAVAFVIVLVGCTSTSEPTSTSSGSESTTTSSTLPGETTTTTAPPLDFTDLPGTESLPQEVRDELLALVRATEEVRGLNFLQAPMISVVSEAELQALVREQFEAESKDLPADEALYQLLGLIDESTDLGPLLTDLYSEQVGGFYDFETEELVVPMTSGGFSQIQRATLVHELTHALTDQHFDLQPKYQAMFDEQRYDEASAYQALMEGDASLAQFLFVRTLSQEELGEFFAETLAIDSDQFNAAPQFLQEVLIFPYEAGLTFAQDLYQKAGGWSAINDAYEQFVELPGSTEQIITPDDFGRDLPLTVAMPAIDVPGYDVTETSVWGELGFRILFEEVLDDEETLVAADGWGGDSYTVWYDGENVAFVMVYEGDTATDETEAEQALLEFARNSVPEPAFVWVEVIDDQLTFIAADVPAVGEAIREGLKS